jgi:hypothetical protein
MIYFNNLAELYDAWGLTGSPDEFLYIDENNMLYTHE